jgi:hypothetical protein
VIKPGVTFEHGFAANMPVARECHGEHRVAHCGALAQGAAAAARAFEISACETRAQRDGAVHLVFVETIYFRRCNGAAKNAEDRARVEPSCRQRRNEIRRQPLHHFIPRGNRGQEVFARCATLFSRRDCRRRHARSRMHQHAKGVPFAARKCHFGVRERCPAAGDFFAGNQNSGAVPDAKFIVGHQFHRVASRLRLGANQN